MLAPAIPLDLIYSDALAARLTHLEPSLSDRMSRGRMVQQINKLALLKIDTRRHRPRPRRRRPHDPGPGPFRGAGLGSILIHRVLQQEVRRRMTPEERAEARHDIHEVLGGQPSRPPKWTIRRRGPSSVCSGRTWRRPGRSSAPTNGSGNCWIDRVRYICLLGGLEQGAVLGRSIDQAWSHRLEHQADEAERPVLRRQLLLAAVQPGHVLRFQSKFAESRKLDEVLEQQRLLLGVDHAHTLMTMRQRSSPPISARPASTAKRWTRTCSPTPPGWRTSARNTRGP